MKIWVDADACPVVSKEILFRAADISSLNARGELYSPDNIKDRLTMRDFTDTLRGSGAVTGGPAALSSVDRNLFANQLDQYLTRNRRALPLPRWT